MEKETIERLRENSDEFKRLEEEHRILDQKIDEINRKGYLTPSEDMEKKRLQKEKLYKKDRIAEMIREYKNSSN